MAWMKEGKEGKEEGKGTKGGLNHQVFWRGAVLCRQSGRLV